MKYKKFIKDNSQRKQYKKTELFQKVYKVLFLYSKDYYFKFIVRKKIFFKFIKNYFKTHINNYCIITGRSRGVYKKFKVSRIIFKNLSSIGLFFGLKKSSW